MDDATEAFVHELVGRAERGDRRALAALRRGLGKTPGSAVEMMPYVVPYLPQAEHGHWAYFVTGSLFGLHGNHSPGVGIGTLCRHVTDNESGEKRFLALLDAHKDELPGHLRRAVSIARQQNQGFDYALLLKDLLGWTHPDRYVQRRWARQFWTRIGGGSHPNEDTQNKE